MSSLTSAEFTVSESRHETMFGAIAVGMGLVTVAQVNECLTVQKELQSTGGPMRRLGDLLVEAEMITREQAEQVFRTQGARGGHTHIQNYRILARIGQGAMGSVFKALQISMDRVVALKVLAPKYGQNTRFVERFFREARAVAKLNHPNIIQGIDVGESNGIHYFAMEYVDGPTVGQLLRRGGALDEKRSVQVILQTAKALEHAQKHGLVHRDVKPDNVMLTRTGQAKLCDLGLAKVTRDELPDLSEAGVSMGTPNYISPEQARGEHDVDIRSDIYSLGSTFFHMVTGQVPFFSESAAVVIARHLNEPPRNPRELNPILTDFAAGIVLKMLQKDRVRRYQTPSELVADLEAVLNPPSHGAPVPPAGAVPPGGPAQATSGKSSGVLNRPSQQPGALRGKMAKRRYLPRDY
ncbi:MAG: serine/threonine protein [Planctomycetota bacterium]|nr:MAG: serine/threonine protein [Planctomycetota bacterium]